MSVAWIHAIKGEENGQQKFRKQTSLQEAWRLSKQSKTKQNKRAEWMVMSSVWSKRRGNCRHASRKCGVASGAALASKGLWDSLCLGPARTLDLLMFMRQLPSSLRYTFHTRHELQYFQLHIHTIGNLHKLWGKKEMRRKYTRLLLVIISQINVYYF